MTRTEKIIDDFNRSAIGSDEEGVAIQSAMAELRRLARLCDAYWKELGDWRKTCGVKDAKYRDGGWYTVPIDSNYRMPLSDATDAARREAGEGTT